MKNSIKASLLVRGIAALAVCALAVLAPMSADANTISVSNRDDSGPGSLRQAIAEAKPGDTITFDVIGTITLTSGALNIGQDLTIQGPSPYWLKISGNHASRVFVIKKGGTATLAGITITRGLAASNDPALSMYVKTGGGILSFGNLKLSNVFVFDNQALGDASAAPFGSLGWAIAGGIASFGTLDVAATRFTGNLARAGDAPAAATRSGRELAALSGIGDRPQSRIASSSVTWCRAAPAAAVAPTPGWRSAAPSGTPAPSPSTAARSAITRLLEATTISAPTDVPITAQRWWPAGAWGELSTLRVLC